MKEMLATIGKKVAGATGRTGLLIKKKSPEILMIAGIVTFVGTVVTACHATLKADEILEKHRMKMEDIEEAKALYEEDPTYYEYDEELYLADRRRQTLKTAVEFGKAYALPVALGALSVTCFVASKSIMHKRYMGVVAAYNAVKEAFDTYRSRVRKEYGPELDRHFRYGTTYETIKEEVVDENGKKKKEEVEVSNTDTSMALPSDSTFFFDESNPNWDPDPHFSLIFLRAQQNAWNDILQVRGHVFLNEVLDSLGIDHTPVGSVVGWLKGHGDNYIDFGLYDKEKKDVRDFINGRSNVIMLEFNHDGVIWNKI